LGVLRARNLAQIKAIPQIVIHAVPGSGLSVTAPEKAKPPFPGAFRSMVIIKVASVSPRGDCRFPVSGPPGRPNIVLAVSNCIWTVPKSNIEGVKSYWTPVSVAPTSAATSTDSLTEPVSEPAMPKCGRFTLKVPFGRLESDAPVSKAGLEAEAIPPEKIGPANRGIAARRAAAKRKSIQNLNREPILLSSLATLLSRRVEISGFR
jgi:hypothetical protein